MKQVGGAPVTSDTLFQAGSISKPVAAMAALHLVQQGRLSLDSDVNSALTSWKVPASTAAPGATVTLRELLTHTAGFTVHGFPGYAAGTPVPTLVQVLDGQSPANTEAIRLESVPGTKWNYSGGGYTVMQQLLIDVSKRPFDDLLRTTVLAPIGMIHSTYKQPLPSSLKAEAATPYGKNRQPISGGAHTYPEQAAAGLWTTPSDLARFVIELQQSLPGKANHVLDQQLTRQMLTPGIGHWGLGLEMGGAPADAYFSHGGVDEGFESLLVGYEKNGNGVVVMTNAEGGSALASEVVRAVAAAYGWPDFQPPVRTAIAVKRSVLHAYVGTYQLEPGRNLVVTIQGGQLSAQLTKQKAFPIFPESKTRFFWKIVDAEIDFIADSGGHIRSFVLHQNGRDIHGIRK